LRVSGLAALLERCRKGGYLVVDDEPLEGYRRAYLADPFGNRIEVMEPATG
jgi:predicted enzyme related to lactoylglutathione lyase